MKPRYTKSLDANHAQIVGYLRANGVEVTDFAEAGIVPDALAFYKGEAKWIEIKVPTRRSNFKYKQLEYIAQTKMPVAFVTSEQMALEYVTTGKHSLTIKQKDAIALLLRFTPKKAYTIAQIEKVLNKS